MEKIPVEKKVALLKTLGMDDAAMYLEASREASDLTRMRFKPTDTSMIQKKIRKLCYQGYLSEHPATVIPFIVSVIAGVTSVIVPCAIWGEVNGIHSWQAGLQLALWINAFSLLAWIPHWICGIGWTEQRSMPLTQWPDDIPYGALLAVKEAKERGFNDFHIFYPINAQKLRMKVDPVITAIRGNRMYEIFAWDDGKVYE